MARQIERRPLEGAEERRSFQKGRMEIVNVGELTLGRAVFDPGWRWSEHVRPLVGTASCEVTHTGYVIEGRMRVRMNNGDEVEFRSGDALYIPPGHDAWIVGDERCVVLDVSGAGSYAQKRK